MKILYIIPYVPYPLQSGGNQAFFNFANEARKEHEVALLLNIRNDIDKRNADELKKVWPDVTIYMYEKANDPEPERKQEETQDITLLMPKCVRRQIRLFEKIKRSMERKIARRYNKYCVPAANNDATEKKKEKETFDIGENVRKHSTLYNKVCDFDDAYLDFVHDICRKGFDLIQTEFYECLPLVYLMPEDVKKVFVHHELRFIRIENEISLFDKVSAADRILFNEIKNQELAMLKHYDKVIVLTDIDRDILKGEIDNIDIYVSPAVTDAAKAREVMPFKQAHDLVFIGSGDHFPNADGVLWFCDKVVPLLNKMDFKGKVYIVGKWNDETKICAEKLYPQIVFTGFVNDLMGFINGKISIVPIRIGSGMRMKILDSVAACAPIVTTSKGCEGLPFINKQDYIIADSPEDFAKAIISMQKDAQSQEAMANNVGKKLHGIMNAQELTERRMSFYQNIK